MKSYGVGPQTRVEIAGAFDTEWFSPLVTGGAGGAIKPGAPLCQGTPTAHLQLCVNHSNLVASGIGTSLGD